MHSPAIPQQTQSASKGNLNSGPVKGSPYIDSSKLRRFKSPTKFTRTHTSIATTERTSRDGFSQLTVEDRRKCHSAGNEGNHRPPSEGPTLEDVLKKNERRLADNASNGIDKVVPVSAGMEHTLHHSIKKDVDDMKKMDRTIQEQVAAHSRSILALVAKGEDLSRRMEELKQHNIQLVQESHQHELLNQNTIHKVVTELAELKSVINSLLGTIMKDQHLPKLAKQLRDCTVARRSRMSLITGRCDSQRPRTATHQRPAASDSSESDWSSLMTLSSASSRSYRPCTSTSKKSAHSPPKAIKPGNLAKSEATKIRPEKRKLGLFTMLCCGKSSGKTK